MVGSKTFRLAPLLAALLAGALIAACGQEADTGAGAPQPSPQPTAAAPPTPTSAPTATAEPAQPRPTATAEASGPIAPGFSLTAADGGLVSLDGLLKEHEAVVLVFYRGSF